jgi:hypothetical protein
MFATPNSPNLPDFLIFLGTVQIPAAALPANSPWPGYALNQAIALVPCYPGIPGIISTLAVYNCATHLVFLMTPDQVGQTYFQTARSNDATSGYNLIAPSTGLVVASSDEGSSVTLTAPEWAKGLTIGQLGYMKTPWGREYLDYIQSAGPTIWGLT